MLNCMGRDRASVRATGEIGRRCSRSILLRFVGVTSAAAFIALGVGAVTAWGSLYVANDEDNTVSQYGFGLGGALVPLFPATTGTAAAPHAVAITPDGKSVYVTDEAADTVSQYDVAAGGSLVPKSPPTVAAGEGPDGISVSPDGRSAYVADRLGDAVSEYDIGPGGALLPKAVASVATGDGPVAIALAADGGSAYVADSNGASVSQYDVAGGGQLVPKFTAAVVAGSTPSAIAVSPNGKSVYVADLNSSTISQYDVASDGALIPKAPTTVATRPFPAAIAISPDGQSAYVADELMVSQYDVAADGTLAPKLPATISAGEAPSGIAIAPDGGSIFVSNHDDDRVAEYDVGAGGTLAPKTPATVSAGAGPLGIAMPPDQGPIASFSVAVPPFGWQPTVFGRQPTEFDGSSSSDPDGSVVRYDWNFGDGTTAPNGGPAPTHTYAAAGVYTVTLRVTDNDGCSTSAVFTGQTAYCNGTQSATTSVPVTIRRIAVLPSVGGVVRVSSIGMSALRTSPSVLTLGGRLVGGHCVRRTNANRHGRRCGRPLRLSISFRLSHSAAVAFLFERLVPGRAVQGHCVAPWRGNVSYRNCTRAVLLRGGFAHTYRPGNNSISVDAGLHGVVASGSYRLSATAAAGGLANARSSVTFTVVP